MTDILLGTVKYAIRTAPRDKIDPESDGYVGKFVFSRGEILVLDSMPIPQKYQTLWHEILHIICGQRNVSLSEEELDAMAHGIVEALTNNPYLRKP